MTLPFQMGRMDASQATFSLWLIFEGSSRFCFVLGLFVVVVVLLLLFLVKSDCPVLFASDIMLFMYTYLFLSIRAVPITYIYIYMHCPHGKVQISIHKEHNV